MESSEKKLVLFGSQITVGGAQRVLLDQAGWFFEHGWDVRAVFFYDKDGSLKQWRENSPFPVEALSDYERGGSKAKNLFGILRGFFRLISLLRKFRPKAIECFTHDADLIGIPAAKLAGVPVRIGAHHGQFVGLGGMKLKLHTLLINSPMTDKLICVSARAKAQALSEGVHEGKIQVIFNGVKPVVPDPAIRAAVRKELGISESEQMILSVGRLVPEKAQHLLIEAAPEVSKKMPDTRFFIAGSGPLMETLQKQINNEGIAERFTLLGNRNDVSRLLNAADCFVLPSETEGMPVSLMEAMSIGLPVVATCLEGIEQLIPDPRFGTLIPFGDVPTLTETLIRTLENTAPNPDAQTRIIQDFSLDASCKQYERIMENK